jgi:hypothetical protein
MRKKGKNGDRLDLAQWIKKDWIAAGIPFCVPSEP